MTDISGHEVASAIGELTAAVNYQTSTIEAQITAINTVVEAISYQTNAICEQTVTTRQSLQDVIDAIKGLPIELAEYLNGLYKRPVIEAAIVVSHEYIPDYGNRFTIEKSDGTRFFVDESNNTLYRKVCNASRHITVTTYHDGGVEITTRHIREENKNLPMW